MLPVEATIIQNGCPEDELSTITGIFLSFMGQVEQIFGLAIASSLPKIPLLNNFIHPGS